MSKTLSRTPTSSPGTSSRTRAMIVRSSRVRPVEVAAEPARPRAGAEELVQQIAVAGLDIDELKADVAGQSGRGDVASISRSRSSSVQTIDLSAGSMPNFASSSG